MSNKYWVFVREVHIRPYRIEADSPAEAKIKLNQLLQKGEAFDPKDIGDLDMSHCLDPVTWSIEADK